MPSTKPRYDHSARRRPEIFLTIASEIPCETGAYGSPTTRRLPGGRTLAYAARAAWGRARAHRVRRGAAGRPALRHRLLHRPAHPGRRPGRPDRAVRGPLPVAG